MLKVRINITIEYPGVNIPAEMPDEEMIKIISDGYNQTPIPGSNVESVEILER